MSRQQEPPGGRPRSDGTPGRQAAGGGGDDHRSPARKGDRWKTVFFGLAALAVVAGAAWGLLGSSLLVVRSVQATGTPLVTRPRILAAAGIRLGTPLIRIDTAAVEHRIDQITQVQSARVSKAWPDKIVISVQDRVPALAVAQDGRFALVDEFGVVVRWVTARPPSMPLLASPAGPATSLRGSAAVRSAVAVLGQIPVTLRRRIVAMRAPAANAVEVILAGRITIVWGGPGRSAAKARELAALMRSNASYYDVSDPGTAVAR